MLRIVTQLHNGFVNLDLSQLFRLSSTNLLLGVSLVLHVLCVCVALTLVIDYRCWLGVHDNCSLLWVWINFSLGHLFCILSWGVRVVCDLALLGLRPKRMFLLYRPLRSLKLFRIVFFVVVLMVYTVVVWSSFFWSLEVCEWGDLWCLRIYHWLDLAYLVYIDYGISLSLLCVSLVLLHSQFGVLFSWRTMHLLC